MVLVCYELLTLVVGCDKGKDFFMNLMSSSNHVISKVNWVVNVSDNAYHISFCLTEKRRW